MKRRIHVHIGHHYFGAGNLGDDLMVAGFISALGERVQEFRITCGTLHEPDSQRRRFPEIEWFKLERTEQINLIRACDVWLGLGDSPFQSEVGTWFLDHLVSEAKLCRRYHKPMYFLGIGVNDAEALQFSQAREVLAQTEYIWTRDAFSAHQLEQSGITRKITRGADLAHVYLAECSFSTNQPHSIGWILNFEKRDAFSVHALMETIAHFPEREHWWLAQEVRALPGSEQKTWAQLPDELRVRFQLRVPNYANATMNALLDCWGVPEILVTSRYHGALMGAWFGARVLAVTRNVKVQGAVEQLGIVSVPSLLETRQTQAGIKSSQRVPRTTLYALTELARACVNDFVYAISQERRRSYFSLRM